jgi:hypothetical protein
MVTLTQHPYWVLLTIFLNFLVFGVPAGLLLDRLLRHEYENHPRDWEADGRPSGFFWCPRDADWWYANTFNFYFYRWFVKTPAWIRRSPTCSRQLNLIRTLTVCGAIASAILVFTQAI